MTHGEVLHLPLPDTSLCMLLSLDFPGLPILALSPGLRVSAACLDPCLVSLLSLDLPIDSVLH